MIFWELFIGFLRVGCFAFGGAYAAIPLIRDIVLSYGWMTEESLTYMIAVSESTPGPIMVNLATYVGSSQAGFFGSVTATTAVVLPAFWIIIIVMAALKNVLNNRWVQAALRGLKPCVIGVILATGVYMTGCGFLAWEDGLSFRVRDGVLTAILALAMFGAPKILKKNVSPILLIVIAGVLGIVFYGF